MNPEHRMLRVRLPGTDISLSRIEEFLSGTGIQLDPQYGPFHLNGAYIVRGHGNPEGFEKAKQIDGVEVFGDPAVRPISSDDTAT